MATPTFCTPSSANIAPILPPCRILVFLRPAVSDLGPGQQPPGWGWHRVGGGCPRLGTLSFRCCCLLALPISMTSEVSG